MRGGVEVAGPGFLNLFMADAWYLTTLDFDTGETVYSRLAGTGFGYNNNYAPVTLAAGGTAYVGVLGGLTVFRDAASG